MAEKLVTMSILGSILKMGTASGRAYLTLLKANRFTIGGIGPAARISKAERSLALLVRNGAGDKLLDLTKNAPLVGRLYGVLGLTTIGHPGASGLLAGLRNRTEEVRTQTACFVTSQPVGRLIAQIEDGSLVALFRLSVGSASRTPKRMPTTFRK